MRRCRSITPLNKLPTDRSSWSPHAPSAAWDQTRSRAANSYGYRNAQTPSSRRPARSASSWIATRPASSPISRWSNSRSSPAAAISRSSTAPCPKACARSAIARSSEIAEIEAYAVGHGSLSNAGPAINHRRRCGPRAFTDEKLDEKVEEALPTAFDIKFVFNKWTLGRRLSAQRRAESALREDGRPRLRPARRRLGFSKARDRGRQRACLRRDDAGRRAASEDASITRCSTAPTPAGASASAISRWRATSA